MPVGWSALSIRTGGMAPSGMPIAASILRRSSFDRKNWPRRRMFPSRRTPSRSARCRMSDMMICENVLAPCGKAPIHGSMCSIDAVTMSR